MVRLLALGAALTVASASGVEAQLRSVAPPALRVGTLRVEEPTALSSLSAQRQREVDRLVADASARVAAAVPMMDENAQRAALVAAEMIADSALAVLPTIEALYWYSTARGLRADLEDGRAQVELAAAVYDDAQAILAFDPDHAGAHHLLGRLHGGVMRLGTVKRFLAVRMLGGGSLSDASWAAAEAHFRAALAEEPHRVEHKLELAALLIDTDRPEEARPLLEDVVRAPTCSAVVAHFQKKARALLDELD